MPRKHDKENRPPEIKYHYYRIFATLTLIGEEPIFITAKGSLNLHYELNRNFQHTKWKLEAGGKDDYYLIYDDRRKLGTFEILKEAEHDEQVEIFINQFKGLT